MTPTPQPSQLTHRARRAATWPRRRRTDAAPQPRRRTRPLPLCSQQVPRLLPLSAPRIRPLLMVPVAGSVPPLIRTRSNFHRRSGLGIGVSTGRQAGNWARHRGAIAGRQEPLGFPPFTPPGIGARAQTEPNPRHPAPQPINSRPVRRPRPRARSRRGSLSLSSRSRMKAAPPTNKA